MNIDVAQHLGAVTRVVTSREHGGRPARVVIATRTYDTDVHDLWDAMTSAERIPRWFLPITGDLRLGGRYQLQGNAGGTIERCEPPEHLALTWEMRGETSWVTVTLSPTEDGRAALHLEHVAHVPEEFWTQYGPGAVGAGWDLTLLGLALHVATGAVVNDPASIGPWMASEGGRAFVRGSCDGWADAAIAAGDAPQDARAAGQRTVTAYTGG